MTTEQDERDREEKRIARQRNCFTFLPVSPSVETLKAAMLQRAYDLLWDGRCEECDAILGVPAEPRRWRNARRLGPGLRRHDTGRSILALVSPVA